MILTLLRVVSSFIPPSPPCSSKTTLHFHTPSRTLPLPLIRFPPPSLFFYLNSVFLFFFLFLPFFFSFTLLEFGFLFFSTLLSPYLLSFPLFSPPRFLLTTLGFFPPQNNLPCSLDLTPCVPLLSTFLSTGCPHRFSLFLPSSRVRPYQFGCLLPSA